MRQTLGFLLCLIAALPPAALHAEVYLLGKLPADGSEFEELLGGQHLYSTTIDLNGAPARLRVSHVTRPLAEAMRACRATFDGAGASFHGGAQMGRGIVERDGRVTRLLAVPGARGGCVLFSMNQSHADYRASRRPPAGNGLPEVPFYGNSDPDLVIRDRERRMALAVETTRDAAPTVRVALAEAMRAAGWQPIATQPRGSALLMYGRADARCSLLVVDAPEGGARITRLHKEPVAE